MKPRLRASLCFLALAAFLAACAGAGPRPLDLRKPDFPELRFEPPAPKRTVLSGGAPAYLLEDHDVPLVRVYLSFRAGSVYDPPDKAGLAQVAGLAWRTGGVAGQSPEAFDEALEQRAIDVSLSLGRDKGSASLSVLSSDWEAGLECLARLILQPQFQTDRVEWAVRQVKEGIRREDDDPDSLAFRELRRALYRGHPRGVIASEETVGRVSRDDAVRLHGRLVADGAWAIGAVGDFDAGVMSAALESHFGRLPGDGGSFPVVAAPPVPEPRTVLVPKKLPQTTLVWARLGPSRTSPGFYPLEIADHALGGGGFQSRLVREVRSNRGLAYSVSSFYDAFSNFGVLGARASTKRESAAEVLDLLSEIPDRAGAEGFSADEIAKAKEAVQNQYVFRYQDSANAVLERMALGLEGLPLDLPAAYLASVGRVGAAEATAAAAAHYRKGAAVVVVVGDVDPASEVWRTEGLIDVIRVP